MQVLTLAQLKTLFLGVTITITGLGREFVRNAYQPNGQPAWEKAQNVAFLNITQVDNSYDKLRDITYLNNDADNAEEQIFYTRVMAVDWTLYGPDSFDLADAIRNGILTEAIRETLAANQVYPVCGISAPTRGPSEFNSQWWERSDLRVTFYIGTLRTGALPYFQGAYAELYDSAGPESVIELPS